MKRALLIMAKRPHPGKTKTRLSPPLSAAAAAELYQCFLKDTLDMARTLSGVVPHIAVAPPEEMAYFRRLAPGFRLLPQVGGSLAQRLDHVLTRCSQIGFHQVVAINSDSPTLPATYVEQAFQQLDEGDVDVVLGPASDGGYYLIGWKRPNSRLVREVQMSTPTVLRDTLKIAEEENLATGLLPGWYDIDGPAGMERLRSELTPESVAGRHTRDFLSRRGDAIFQQHPADDEQHSST